MPFAAAISTNPQGTLAAREVCAAIAGQGVQKPDLALVFFSPDHAEEVEVIAAELRQGVQSRLLLGCVGESIIGNDQEIEGRPALTLWAAKWAGPIEAEP